MNHGFSPFLQPAICALALMFGTSSAAIAADTDTDRDHSDFVSAALTHSRNLATRHHLVAQVTITTPEGHTLKFQYDQYPEVNRLRFPEGLTLTKKRGSSWLMSEDWGKTGAPVDAEMALDYDTLVSFVHAPLNSITETRDAAQGGSIMRLLHHSQEDGRERFVFERSREQAKGDHVYPCFSFERFKNSEVPHALLCGFKGPLYTGDRILMVSITYDYRVNRSGRAKVRLAGATTETAGANTVATG